MTTKTNVARFGALIALVIPLATRIGTGQVAVQNQGFIPYANAPINYRTDPIADPVAKLQAKIRSGESTLRHNPQHGYLESVLEALKIPASSQSLVFSKTSFQFRKISPKTPRALYFNGEVYVGWVNGGGRLELISFDPRQGAIFYLLNQEPAAKPEFERAELDCTQCHVASATRDVPGVLIKSIFPTALGTASPKSQSFITGHQSPLSERFGGWYVTGTHGRQTHMGNVIVADPSQPEALDRSAGANVTDLSKRFDTSAYLTDTSDIVAQLVQAHQTQAHNLITLTNYQTRLAVYADSERRKTATQPPSDQLSELARTQFEGPAEELVRYLLFVGEAPLEDKVAGTSRFAQEFAALGPRDRRGRSLRDFDLRTRLFRFPCSYLIYSDSFDALPAPAKAYIYRRLFEVLTGQDQSPDFSRLSNGDRKAIFEILVATKSDLPDEWAQYGKRVKGKSARQRNLYDPLAE